MSEAERVRDAVNNSLRYVLGHWMDMQGSRYAVELDESSRSCTVNTERPDSDIRATKALIRVKVRNGKECVLWGRNFALDMDSISEDHLRWEGNTSRRPFVWRREVHK